MADRTYSKAFDINRSALSFNYVEDSTLNGGSGAWRPLRPTDFSSITLSGASVSVDNGPVIAAIGSGNNSLASILTNTSVASKAFTPSFTNGLLAKNSAATLYTINGFNNYTGIQYLHIYDNNSATAANLVGVLAIDSKDNFSIDFGPVGLSMTSGIYARNSLSPVTQENGGNDIYLTISYR